MNMVKRRQLMIDRPLQMGFIVKFCSFVMIVSLLVGCLVFFLTLDSTTVTIENTKVAVKATSDFILPGLVLTVVIVSVFSAIAVYFSTLLMTHKVAGPVFRFKREIDLMKAGDLNRHFGIRRDDQFHDLSEALDDMTAGLRNKHLELKSIYRRLRQHLDEKGLETNNELRELLKEMGETLKYFKVE